MKPLDSAVRLDLSKAKRILVIGCSGSGKSTLTRILSEKFSLPPVHLDVHYWKPGWTESSKEEWSAKVSELTAAEKWIMDGTFADSFNLRFPVADAIIVINLPRQVCLWRAITRVFKYNEQRSRPDMATGCHETFDLNFYKYIWTFNRKVKPLIHEAAERFDCQSKLIFLNRSSDVDMLISSSTGKVHR